MNPFRIILQRYGCLSVETIGEEQFEPKFSVWTQSEADIHLFYLWYGGVCPRSDEFRTLGEIHFHFKRTGALCDIELTMFYLNELMILDRVVRNLDQFGNYCYKVKE